MRNLLVLASVCVFAAHAQTPRELLVSMESSDELEFVEFDYTDFQKVKTQTYVSYMDGKLCVDMHEYNDKQQLVSILTMQDLDYGLDFNNLSQACRVDYAYDEAGNLTVRDNFNRDFLSGELTQSARIVYSYDEKGRRTKEEQFWSFDLEKPFLRIFSTYNPEGQLVTTEEYQQDWGNKDLYSFSGRTDYTYDGQGRLVQTDYFYAYVGNEETGELYTELVNSEKFYYDEEGDVVKHETLSASGRVTNREVFVYDTDTDVADVAYPVTPEYPVAQQKYSKHKVVSEEKWATDLNTDELFYSHSMLYNYESCIVGINVVRSDRQVTMNYNPASREMVFDGDVSGASVRLVSASGQTLLSHAAEGRSLSVANLVPGTYILLLQKPGQSPVAQKFVVK